MTNGLDPDQNHPSLRPDLSPDYLQISANKKSCCQEIVKVLMSSVRVPTRQGKVMEIWFFFKVREKSGNSVKWSGKLENLQKSGKSQGIMFG